NFRVLSLENGRLLWEHIAEESPVVPGPIVGKLLIASAHDAGLIGFSLAEGVELWRRETDRSFEQPALALEDAILGVDGTLVCLDAATGTRRWEQRLTDPDDAFYRAFAAGKLLLADTWSGRLLALDPASGCIRWERRCGALLGLSVGIGRVYTWAEPPTQGEEGRLLALALDTGEPAWEMRSRRLLQDVTAAGDAVVVEWKNRVLALAGGP
ncbi:MAG: PQQ-like beta-propeller repeat protein, partial [Armatimonadetes bacterium]|nr:PQQ-like beta-propeller repeat protein [Armatimonadota bacterium]